MATIQKSEPLRRPLLVPAMDNHRTLTRMSQPPAKSSPLETLSQKAAAEYLRRSSLTFLECAINLMATHMSLDEVAAVLREEADQLDRMR